MQRLKKEQYKKINVNMMFCSTNVCTRAASAFVNQENTILSWRVGTKRPTRAPQHVLSRATRSVYSKLITLHHRRTTTGHSGPNNTAKDKFTIPAIHRAGRNFCEFDLFPFSSRSPLALPNATALFLAGVDLRARHTTAEDAERTQEDGDGNKLLALVVSSLNVLPPAHETGCKA